MRTKIIGAVLALATVFAAAPAMAGEHEKPSFPMPAAQFKARIDARETRAREHMEKRAAKLSPEEAKALRTKFDAGVAQVNAEVGKAVADGTVTKDEANAVRKVVKEVRGHHGRHGHHGDKAKRGEKR